MAGRSEGIDAGPTRERSPDACLSCRAPWPGKAGHMRVGWEPCHACSGAQYGGHRTWTCLTCGVETFDRPCDRLNGGRTVQRLEPRA